MVANTRYATRMAVLLASPVGGLLLPDEADELKTQTYLCVKYVSCLCLKCFLYKGLNKDDIDASYSQSYGALIFSGCPDRKEKEGEDVLSSPQGCRCRLLQKTRVRQIQGLGACLLVSRSLPTCPTDCDRVFLCFMLSTLVQQGSGVEPGDCLSTLRPYPDAGRPTPNLIGCPSRHRGDPGHGLSVDKTENLGASLQGQDRMWPFGIQVYEKKHRRVTATPKNVYKTATWAVAQTVTHTCRCCGFLTNK
jgi:hypothetical protein